MNRIEAQKYSRRLKNTWPLFGAMIRRWACKRLAEDSSAAAVAPLAEALRSQDLRVAGTANHALRSLRSHEAVDAICALWAEKHDETLGQIIAECGYIAQQPVRVRVLSALKAGKPGIAGENAKAIPEAIAALKDRDALIAHNAAAALRSLKVAEAIDAFCALWAEKRNETLGEIIAGCGYIAQQPVRVRVLSALKAGRLDLSCENAEAVEALIAALQDKDPSISSAADSALRAVRDRAAVDQLCSVAIEDPSGPVAKTCVETGKRPSDPEEACLFLFVTGQFDAYLQEDYEFQHLHAAYERASEQARGHVMAIYRSGDRRWAGFLGVARKPLSKCTPQEIEIFIESAARHKDWQRLFRAFLELPVGCGLRVLEHLQKSSWEPAEPEMKSLYNAALREYRLAGSLKDDQKDSSLFERWLAEGRQNVRGSESELLAKLKTATPPESVKIVGALAGTSGAKSAVAAAVRSNPHWLIRLAGYAVGLEGLSPQGQEEVNHWVREIGPAKSLMDFWPGRATPDDIENLDAGPREGKAGRLGTARNILRLLINHRMTTPVVEEMQVEVAEDAASVEDAD